MMNKDQWKPSNGIVLESNAKQAIFTNDNILVQAGPGAGKTELLAQKASYLFQTGLCPAPFNILAISFKRDAAENIKDRVSKRVGKEEGSRFISKTFDAFAKLIVDRFYLVLPKDLRPRPQYEISSNSTQTKIYEYAFGYVPDRNAVNDLLKVDLNDINPQSNNYKFWKYMLMGEEKTYLTFEMISRLALYIIQHNKYVRHIIRSAFPFVFLDEFQDTTVLQYDIFRECFLNSESKITAVGDNKQQIMLWAGADKEIFGKYTREFRATKVFLKENHRSALNIVKLQKLMYEKIDKDINPDIIINKNKDEGKVFLIETNEPSKEAEIVGENIIKEIRMGVKPSEIAILVKQRPEDYIRNIKEYLKTKNVTVRVESKYTETFSEPIVKLILKMILASINVINGQEWQELVDETSEIFLINLADAEIEQKYIKKLNVFLDKLFKNLLVQVHENRSKSNYYCKIVESIIDFFTINRLQVYYPEYLEIDQLNRTKTQFIEQLKECGSINELNTDIKEIWKEIIDNYLGKNSIATLTIHKSKGLEYNSVYFIGLEDSAFWSFSNQSESDRKAFFVAISRAKEKLYFTFCRGRQTVRNIYQTKKNIKEFYELFDKSGIVKEINDNNNS